MNRSNAFYDSIHGISYSAYLTFENEKEASTCIHATNEFILDGRRIKATFGTTKYCSYFIRGIAWPNPECLYLHDMGNSTDTFNREEMLHNRHIEPTGSIFNTVVVKRQQEHDILAVLPSVTIHTDKRDRIAGQLILDPSCRESSRYSFAIEAAEEIPAVPAYIQYMLDFKPDQVE